jgi:hypothetical protein
MMADGGWRMADSHRPGRHLDVPRSIDKYQGTTKSYQKVHVLPPKEQATNKKPITYHFPTPTPTPT